MKLLFNVLLLCFGLFILLPCVVVSCTPSGGDDVVLVEDNYDYPSNDTLVSDADTTYCFLHHKQAAEIAQQGQGQLAQAKAAQKAKIKVMYSQTAPETSFLIRFLRWFGTWGRQLLIALIPLLEVVVRLTPSERDNSIFNFLKRLLDVLVPNRSVTEGEDHA